MTGAGCRTQEAGWRHARPAASANADASISAAASADTADGQLLRADQSLVRCCLRRADAVAGAGLGGHRQWGQHAGRGPDRLRQDTRRLPLGHRQAGDRAGPAGSRAALPGALHLAAQGAGRGHRAEPALAAHRRRSRCPPAWRRHQRHQGRRPHRGHRSGRAAQAGRKAARHPDHHARVAVPAADVQGAGGAQGRRDSDRRRGACSGRYETGRSSGTVARAPRCAQRRD